MTSLTTKPDSSQPASEKTVDLFDNRFDPIETEAHARPREFHRGFDPRRARRSTGAPALLASDPDQQAEGRWMANLAD
jgi:hypothetical protein